MAADASARLAGLSAALGLGAPEDVLGPLGRLYAELDAELAAATAALALPCHRGCDACCREAVFLSAPEFLAVARHLLCTWDAPAREALVARMGALARRFEDELALLDALPAGAERDEVAARVRFDCPFLAADGACGVHPARELNARTFGQSWDEARGHPFGCERTHARLAVLGQEVGPALPGARAARRRLAALVPGAGAVYVYPWWFSRFGRWLLDAPR